MTARDQRPVYVQIAEALKTRIVAGHYGRKIDGELPLAREWNVSRRTIQQALGVLVEEGLLVRRHGQGTFVNPVGVEKSYRTITSITEGIAGQGLQPQFRVLESRLALASDEEQDFFELSVDQEVYRHRRLVLGDARPLAVVSTSLNVSLVQGLELSHLDSSLYGMLRKTFGRTIVHAEDRYLPALADSEIATLLDIPEHSAIFVATRRGWDQSGAAIELSRIAMRPVPLEISIRHTGFPFPDAQRTRSPAIDAWDYAVGFGDFLK